MKDRPLILDFLFLFFISLTLSFPLQVMWIYGHHINELDAVINKLTFFNILCMIILATNAWLSWRGAKFLKWTVPLSIFVITLNNLLVSSYGNDFSYRDTTIATVFFMIITSSIYFSKGRNALNYPEKRWWLTPKRYAIKRSITLFTSSEKQILGSTFDISSSGVFVSIYSKDGDSLPEDIIEIAIQGKRGRSTEMLCKGRVVRKCEENGRYPAGLGIQFEGLSFLKRIQLRLMILTSAAVAR